MKITLSIIKADVGSIGGHIKPSETMIRRVKEFIASEGKGLRIDSFICHTGDDISILSSHTHGVDDSKVHKLCWDAFKAATEVAKKEGLYGAGQDLLKDAFSGNVRGLGPASAEMEFVEREAEPFLLFMADKTEPGAYNLPLYLAFCDPMFAPGLMLSTKIKQGFRFTIMDVNHTEATASSIWTRPRTSTTWRRSCATTTASWSNRSRRVRRARSPPWSPPRGCTTSRGNTPGRTIR